MVKNSKSSMKKNGEKGLQDREKGGVEGRRKSRRLMPAIQQTSCKAPSVHSLAY